MFRIGEFSKIAQVSGRLLRYYDEIDLLKPQYIDQWTNYRYYTADQLPRLNRILALKELGLSLDQIQQLLDQEIDTDGVRNLYLERKAEIEQSLREELSRLHQVQLRLNQLDRQEKAWFPDIVVKEVSTQQILAHRSQQITGERFFQIFDALVQRLAKSSVDRSKFGSIVTLLHSDIFIPEEEMDLEIGFLLNTGRAEPLTVFEDVMLMERELTAVAQMATVVHQGWDNHPVTYNALGRWLEENRYTIVGPGRELLLENHYPEEPEKCIVEIQFPVEKVEMNDFSLLASG